MIEVSRDIPVARLENTFFGIVDIEDSGFELARENHRHDFFEILWFTSSVGVAHYIDFEPYPVESGLVYFMAPGQVHAYEGPSPSGYVIVFSLEMFSTIMNPQLRVLFNPFMNSGVRIGESEHGVLLQLAGLMALECQGKKDFFILRCYLKVFLLQIARIHHESAFALDKAGQRMSLLFELLEANFRKERHAGFYASALGITPKRLNEILHQKFDLTLTRILHIRLILEAKREIAYGRKSFKEIAFELGFSDQAYFSRFFKVQTGMMPAAFRSRMFRHVKSDEADIGSDG
ncbi:helix-turn-helix domain-containing protein [Pelodictyon phaeoclathratiforme]|uniref:Transcriptional regulator, AraC family n=1 Tax=Pelodictyon phaeoclathratiforme (strain DSM 5477 / BU-1) TaxID=324925 RepID=B4SG84_PELPB|nr:helix-turn-helix domain-containing protein [Pelodictyon phaeoclathratiforme]ACF43395.1 transcriptional regulator, AraC family [Pelodictyon phaeoclathratiforme BU-1]